MSSKIEKNDATVMLVSVQIPQTGLSAKIVDYIVHNQSPVYPEDYVKATNLKTGIELDMIVQISRSIHNPQFSWWIYKMVALTLVKLTIGQPDGSGDVTSMLQSYYHTVRISKEIDDIDEGMSESMMHDLDLGGRPYSSYSDAWKKRLNLVVWSAVEHNVARYVQSNKIA